MPRTEARAWGERTRAATGRDKLRPCKPARQAATAGRLPPGRVVAGLICAALIASVVPAHCQGDVLGYQGWGSTANYVNITKAKVERLSNATRIILEADGTLRTSVNIMQFFEVDDESGRWCQKQMKRFSISILNAQSQIGRFVDVGIYPASHVTLSVPTEAQQGVGLNITLALYIPARVGRMQQGDWVADVGQWGWGRRDQGMRVDMILSRNGRKLIITVQSDRHYDADLEKAEAQKPSSMSLLLSDTPDGCRLRAINAPLHLVMDELCRQSDVEIVVHPAIDKRITANLPPLSADDLIKLLCRVNCLDLAKRDGPYFISTGSADDVASYRAAHVRKLPLRSISVDDALLLLPQVTLKHLKADMESNTLVASGPPQLLDKIEADLKVLDHPGHQIRLRVLVVELRKPRMAMRLPSALIEGGNTSIGVAPIEGDISIKVVDQSLDRIRLDLQSLEQREAVRTDAQPEIAVVSGREARVFVGKQQYYRFLRQTWYGTELQLRKVDVGVRLSATPWTGDGRAITIAYKVGADSIVSRSLDGLPLVSRQAAAGTLRIASGDTVIFGGLRQRNAFAQEHRVHPLDAAPMVGELLRTETTAYTDSEFLICLSAEAIRTPPVIADKAAGGAL